MSVLFVMIGASLLIALGFLAAFFWAIKDKQFDDTYTPSVRMLFDENNMENNKKNNIKRRRTDA
jgi:cbb3-type cytochrome oxidase maturation protein